MGVFVCVKLLRRGGRVNSFCPARVSTFVCAILKTREKER